MGRALDLIGKRFGRLVVQSSDRSYKAPNGQRKIKWVCLCDCGNTTTVFTSNLTRTTNPTVSCKCYRIELARSQKKGELSTSWKGGRRTENGYVLVYKKDHPRSKKNGYIREHTLVMESKIGRFLVKGENVHHINGDRSDNRPENLELWNMSQPPGQRVEDKLKWAKEIVRLYG